MTGAEFKALRESLKLSQQKMADLLGVSYATIQGWESGRRRITHLTGLGIQVEVERYRKGKAGAAAA